MSDTVADVRGDVRGEVVYAGDPGGAGGDAATCTAGLVVPAVVAAGPTTGIVYVVTPASLGNGTSPVAVTVTATVTDGFGWGTISRAVATGRCGDGDVDGDVVDGVVCAGDAGGADGGPGGVCRRGGDGADVDDAVDAGITYTVAPAGP